MMDLKLGHPAAPPGVCVGRGSDSQAPSTSTLYTTTHLLNHLTFAGGAADLLLSSATRQGTRRGGTCNKEPEDLQPLPPSL